MYEGYEEGYGEGYGYGEGSYGEGSALSFPRGLIYTITCLQGNQNLKMQAKEATDFNESRVLGDYPNENDNNQLFMVEKVGQSEDQFEIVNCLSGLVWDEEDGEVKLKQGKQKGDQLFSVEKAPMEGNAFWIKCSSKGDTAVALEGILRYKAFDPNSEAQIFMINQAKNNQTLNRSCVLVASHSGKALDVPNATFTEGERIVQWTKNRRFNQRWAWEPSGPGYMLKSLLTGQCLDIAGEATEGGSKVVQWPKTGGTNQIWAPEQVGQGTYKIRSLHANGMYLCIQGQDVNDGGKLEIWDQDNPSMNWKIEGYVPN